MTTRLSLLFAFLIAGLVIALTNPFTDLGDRIGPGWADIINGGGTLLMFLVVIVIGLVGRRRI